MKKGKKEDKEDLKKNLQEKAKADCQHMETIVGRMKKEAKTAYLTFLRQEQVKLKISPTSKKINIAKDEIKDVIAFHMLVLASSQVSKISFKIQQSKFHEKIQTETKFEDECKLFQLNEQAFFKIRQQNEKAFESLQKLRIEITCVEEWQKQNAFNLVVSFLSFLKSIKCQSINSLHFQITSTTFSKSQYQTVQSILSIGESFSIKSLFIPYILEKSFIEGEAEFQGVRQLKLLQCEDTVNSENLLTFLKKFPKLTKLYLELKPKIYFTNFEPLSQVLGDILPLLEKLQINHLAPGNYQKALMNILENSPYLGNLSVSINNQTEKQKKIKNLISMRMAVIQQLLHMVKILEKEGFDYSTCMGIMNRVKPFVI